MLPAEMSGARSCRRACPRAPMAGNAGETSGNAKGRSLDSEETRSGRDDARRIAKGCAWWTRGRMCGARSVKNREETMKRRRVAGRTVWAAGQGRSLEADRGKGEAKRTAKPENVRPIRAARVAQSGRVSAAGIEGKTPAIRKRYGRAYAPKKGRSAKSEDSCGLRAILGRFAISHN